MGYLTKRLRRVKTWSAPQTLEGLIRLVDPPGDTKAARRQATLERLKAWAAKGEATRDGKCWRVRWRRETKYQACFLDADGREHRIICCKDKQASWATLARLENRARAGEEWKDPFGRWRRLPLADHVADFKAHLEARGTSPSYQATSIQRLLDAFDLMGVRSLTELSTSKIERLLAALVRPAVLADGSPRPHKKRGEPFKPLQPGEGMGFSHTTHNHVRATLSQFSSWLVERRRWAVNFMRTTGGGPAIPPRKVAAEKGWKVRQRRALIAEELRALVVATRQRDRQELLAAKPNAGPEELTLAELNGQERVALYLTAALAGLRRSELRSLRWARVLLEAELPAVVVLAEHAKNRREASIPIPCELAAELRAWRTAWARKYWRVPKPTDIVFSVPNRVVAVLRRDCEAAGIEVEGPDGRIDLHALRHTYVSLLARAGTPPAVAQKLARHADLATTSKVYTHLVREDTLAAIRNLPSVLAPTAHKVQVGGGRG